jgi:hypothetical protein
MLMYLMLMYLMLMIPMSVHVIFMSISSIHASNAILMLVNSQQWVMPREAWLIDVLTSQKATRGQGETFH